MLSVNEYEYEMSNIKLLENIALPNDKIYKIE